MRSTIKDVAKLAGVSTKTVSNVVNNNSDRFSVDTRERVLAAIEKLNYQPNRAAQYMRSGVIGILALAIPDLGNPYFSEIGREIIDAAKAQGYTVLIEHTAGRAENERLLLGGSRATTVDGVILDPVGMTEDEIFRTAAGTPVVLLGERVTGEFYDHVMIDNTAAAQVLTEHLLELGNKRIAILPVVPDKPSSLFHMRYQGYVNALQAAGIQPDPPLVVAPRHTVSLTHRDGIDCVEQLIKQAIVPDAIFCLNDRVALGVMSTLIRHGYRIPDDVAVAGFDNLTESKLVSPALTTISPDKQAIGRLAVSLLIDRIKGKRTGPPEQFHPEYKLVIRESTIGDKASRGKEI